MSEVADPRSLAGVLALTRVEAELHDTHEDLLALSRMVLAAARVQGVRTPRVLHLAEALVGAADDVLAEIARRRVDLGDAAEQWADTAEGKAELSSFLASLFPGELRDIDTESD